VDRCFLVSVVREILNADFALLSRGRNKGTAPPTVCFQEVRDNSTAPPSISRKRYFRASHVKRSVITSSSNRRFPAGKKENLGNRFHEKRHVQIW